MGPVSPGAALRSVAGLCAVPGPEGKDSHSCPHPWCHRCGSCWRVALWSTYYIRCHHAHWDGTPA